MLPDPRLLNKPILPPKTDGNDITAATINMNNELAEVTANETILTTESSKEVKVFNSTPKHDSPAVSSKPPYSYIALIAMAIRDSPRKMATLAEINAYLTEKYDFFRGSYKGWRNSIRHNLSLNECFVKILRDPKRPWAKDNYWILNPNSEYTFADGVFSRRRKRLNNERKATYVSEIDQTSKHISYNLLTKKTGLNDFSIESILRKPEKVAPQNTLNFDNDLFKDIPMEKLLSSTALPTGHFSHGTQPYQNSFHFNYGFYPEFQSKLLESSYGNLLTNGVTPYRNHYHPYSYLGPY